MKTGKRASPPALESRRVETLERAAAAAGAEQAPPAAAAEPAPPGVTPPAEAEEREAMTAPAEPTPPAEIGAIEATEEEAERALVQTGALLLPAGTAEVEPNFSYVRQEFDDAVFLVEDDGKQILEVDEVSRDNLEAGLGLRLGLPFDSQLEVDVPYRTRTSRP